MPDAKRNGRGQYLIRPEDGGKEVAHTRATTVAKTLDDTYNIALWQQRHVALGLAKRPDLMALASTTEADDKRTLNRVCKDAIEAAAASSAANTGTAIHSLTERVDRGQEIDSAHPFLAELAAYRACLDENSIEIDPRFIECICVIDGLAEPVAGTADRIVRWNGGWHILDIKTGGNLYFQWRSISIQLALYSRANALYDPEAEQRLPMPDVNRDQGIVLHLPAGEAKCEAHLVDLNSGWEAARQSLWVRQWRRRDDLAVAA